MLNKKVIYKIMKIIMSNSILINFAEFVDFIKIVFCVIIDIWRFEVYEESYILDVVNLYNIFIYLVIFIFEGIVELKGKFEIEFGVVGLLGKEIVIIYE